MKGAFPLSSLSLLRERVRVRARLFISPSLLSLPSREG